MSKEGGSFGLKLTDIGETVTSQRKVAVSGEDLFQTTKAAQKAIEELKSGQNKPEAKNLSGENLVYTC